MLLCPWDFPGKNPGMGWHFLLQTLYPLIDTVFFKGQFSVLPSLGVYPMVLGAQDTSMT